MTRSYPVLLLLAFAFVSCFPKDMKEQMGKAIQQSQVMMADEQFKTMLNNIEVFKLRNGHYPDSLRENTFVSAFDSTYFRTVEYTRQADKYELNLKVVPKGLEPYPPEFWTGLGCIKSNLMPEGYISKDPRNDSLPADSVLVE